jgi:hypothetical protein
MGSLLNTLRASVQRRGDVSIGNERNENNELTPQQERVTSLNSFISSPYTVSLDEPQACSVDCVAPPLGDASSPEEAAELRDLYEERAAIRQYDGHYTRPEAEQLAWGEVINEWRRRHWRRFPPNLCSGCEEALPDAEAFDLGDGNRAHNDPDWKCVIATGRGGRERLRRR